MSSHRQTVEFYSGGVVLSALAAIMLGTLLTPEPVATVAQDIIITSRSLPEPQIRKGIPKRIRVPSVAIDLRIADGRYSKRTGEWTISSDKGHFALPSVPVNDNNGTTLIYGHAQPQVFARLAELPPAARATVYTAQYKFTYRYTSKRDVIPSDTSVFRTSGSPKLVLQTCTGLWDSHRALYSFALESVKTL